MQITIREPGSAITHYIGMLLSLIAAAPLLVKAEISGIPSALTAMAIFILTMILLYAASTIYHTLDVKAGVLKAFRKLDHMMIFVLIAGTYTPICLLVLKGKVGMIMLALVWGIAVVGMVLKAFWVTCPKWFSSIIYIAMGWICLLVFPTLLRDLKTPAFLWLLAGGILYTVGGVVYALRLQAFNCVHKYFGSHEIFHLFVMAGSFCHFVVMYWYLV
ncbi:hemolysin III family protein [Roseburia sp. BX1005]|uniref:Hemolysin III family protein n=1 Tax=Roseburia zhanii TaxID=2763064 RepID=A0A923LP06_9FIRM|nr:hemolysin III family protein [Roseburia zhanii]MBC5714347.1 hemolysin III family protein [Roseburia zhanii]